MANRDGMNLHTRSWERWSIQLEAVRMGLVAPGRHTDHHGKLEFGSLTVMVETEKLRKADMRT